MKKKKLFDYFVKVKLGTDTEHGENATPKPSVLFQFPTEEPPKADKHLISNQVPLFCFPDAANFPKRTLKRDEQFFSFVLTDVSGAKRYGFCYREFPRKFQQAATLSDLSSKGSVAKQWPVGYCILTQNPFFNLFEEMLVTLSKLAGDAFDLKSALNTLMYHQWPVPGQEIRLMLGPEKDFRLRRSTVDENVFGFLNFFKLLSYLDAFTIAIVYVSMLLERRFIFISSKVGVLGDCVQAFSALLYPFEWQHVFIPILPPSMLDIVCAPMPFILGVLDISCPTISNMPVEEAIYVDLDNRVVIGKIDDYMMLPHEVIDELTLCISHAQRICMNYKGTRRPNLKVLERGILRFASRLLFNFKNHISNGKMDNDKFETSCSPGFSKYINIMSGSQLWNMFIQYYTNPETVTTQHLDDFEKFFNNFDHTSETEINEEVTIKTGWLTKQGEKSLAWQQRYFILTGSEICYKKTRTDTEFAGRIPIRGIVSVKLSDERENCIAITIENGRIYLAFHETAPGAESWLSAISYRLLVEQSKQASAAVIHHSHVSNTARHDYLDGRARQRKSVTEETSEESSPNNSVESTPTSPRHHPSASVNSPPRSFIMVRRFTASPATSPPPAENDTEKSDITPNQSGRRPKPLPRIAHTGDPSFKSGRSVTFL